MSAVEALNVEAAVTEVVGSDDAKKQKKPKPNNKKLRQGK